MGKLAPCIDCRTECDNVIMLDTVRGDVRKRVAVYCFDCDAHGPASINPQEAVDGWNRRNTSAFGGNMATQKDFKAAMNARGRLDTVDRREAAALNGLRAKYENQRNSILGDLSPTAAALLDVSESGEEEESDND